MRREGPLTMKATTDPFAPDLEQAVKNHIKVARSAIRLKHSVLADNELAVVIPKLRTALAAQMQTGRIDGMTTEEMLRLAEGK